MISILYLTMEHSSGNMILKQNMLQFMAQRAMTGLQFRMVMMELFTVVQEMMDSAAVAETMSFTARTEMIRSTETMATTFLTAVLATIFSTVETAQIHIFLQRDMVMTL